MLDKVSQRLITAPSAVRKAFDSADHRGRGSLTPKEQAAFLHAILPDLSQQEVHYTLHYLGSLDVNDDGLLTFQVCVVGHGEEGATGERGTREQMHTACCATWLVQRVIDGGLMTFQVCDVGQLPCLKAWGSVQALMFLSTRSNSRCHHRTLNPKPCVGVLDSRWTEKHTTSAAPTAPPPLPPIPPTLTLRLFLPFPRPLPRPQELMVSLHAVVPKNASGAERRYTPGFEAGRGRCVCGVARFQPGGASRAPENSCLTWTGPPGLQPHPLLLVHRYPFTFLHTFLFRSTAASEREGYEEEERRRGSGYGGRGGAGAGAGAAPAALPRFSKRWELVEHYDNAR